MNDLRLVYSDLSINAKQNFTYSLNNQWSETRGTDLQIEDPTYNHFGTLEGDNWLLTDEVLILPDDLSNTYLGLWSSNLSEDDNTFSTPVELTIEAQANYSSVGFTLTFEEFFNVYPVDVTITWYRGNTQLDSKNYTCDSSQFFFSNIVENFNKVVFTFNSMNKPSKALKIYKLDFGIIRTYTNKNLINVKVNNQISAISNEIAINTMDFDLITDDDTALYFQYKQPVKLYINNVLEGVYYITEGTRTTINKYKVKSEDKIALLDGTYFVGGMYNNYSTEDLIEDIFDVAGVEYDLKDSPAITTLSGYIPYCTCRQALQQVLFACGMVCDTSNSETVNIFNIDTTSQKTFDESEIITGQKTKTDKRISEVQLEQYSYKTSTETDTLYDASDSGLCTDRLIVFNSPYHNLAITGGSIIESGVNYAIITITSATGTLTGQRYEENVSIYSIKNLNVNVYDPENIIKSKGCYLINNSNASTIAQKIYDYYIVQTTITTKLVGLENKVGETITVDNSYLGLQTGVIEKESFDATYDGVVSIELH